MTSRALIVIAVTLTAMGLASPAAAQNGYSFSDAARSASAYSRATVRPQMACRDLLGMTDPDMSIVSAEVFAGGGRRARALPRQRRCWRRRSASRSTCRPPGIAAST